MSSPRKQAANRNNAQKSTGPRTPAGKRSSSRNALKHGLASRDPVHLPPSIEQQLPDRIAMWELTVGPVASGRRWILRKMAVASLQADACEQQQANRLFLLQVDALEKLTRPPKAPDTAEAAPASDDSPDAPPCEFPLIDITPTGLTLNRYHHESLRMVLRLMRRLEQSAPKPDQSGQTIEDECRRDFERAYNSLPVPSEPGRKPEAPPPVLCELDPAPGPHPPKPLTEAPASPPATSDHTPAPPDPARYAARYRALLFEELNRRTPRSAIDHDALLARARRDVDGTARSLARKVPGAGVESIPISSSDSPLPAPPAPSTPPKRNTGRSLLDELGPAPGPPTLPFTAGRPPSRPRLDPSGPADTTPPEGRPPSCDGLASPAGPSSQT